MPPELREEPHDPAHKLHPIDADPGLRTYLRRMYERRHFAFALPAEELRVTHQNTFLGNVWHLINPVLTVIVYYIVFGTGLRAGKNIENYILWLTVGVFAYRLTQASVQGGARSIANNQGLIRSLRFPRALLPISVVVSDIYTFGFQLSVLALVALGTGEGINRRWLLIPLVLIPHTAVNLGGAFITARMAEAYQDVRELIPFLLRLGVFASGVMIPIHLMLDEGDHGLIGAIVLANPLLTLLEMYRWIFLGTSVDAFAVVRTTVICFLTLLFGFRYFRAAEWRYGRN